jgi:hypothetical protein
LWKDSFSSSFHIIYCLAVSGMSHYVFFSFSLSFFFFLYVSLSHHYLCNESSFHIIYCLAVSSCLTSSCLSWPVETGVKSERQLIGLCCPLQQIFNIIQCALAKLNTSPLPDRGKVTNLKAHAKRNLPAKGGQGFPASPCHW